MFSPILILYSVSEFRETEDMTDCGVDLEDATSLSDKEFVYKVPAQLQWLVVDTRKSVVRCWVFYSRIQKRLKCRTHHPNSPGTKSIERLSSNNL